MDLADLRMFLSLCETENMRDTAAHQRVNQSNVSRALARLETELAVELFHRHGRRLQLNRHGRQFRDHADRAVAELTTGSRRVREDVDAEHGVIHLGFLQSVAREVVPGLVRRFRATTPGARFELRQAFARELYAALEQDTLDAAVTTPPRTSDPRIGFIPLIEQQLCVAVPPGHRLADRGSLTLADVADEPFVGFNLATDLRRVIDRLCADTGVEPRIAFESGEIDTLRGLISAGLGVGVLPRPAVAKDDDPVYLDLIPARTRIIGVAWHAGRSTTPVAARFIAQLTER